MYGISCCKDCTERYVGCHSKCEKYLEEKQLLEKQKNKKDANKFVPIYKSDFEMLACMHRLRKDKRR